MSNIYLYLNETAHGKRFWSVHYDSDVGKLLPPDRTIRVIGPAEVGPDGYETEEEAVQALADFAGVDLEDPATW